MIELFSEPFFQRAFLGGVLIGLLAPFIGVFVVLRRLSMIGDTMAHVSIAGVALGFLLNIYPLSLGLLFALLAGFAIERLRKAYKTYAELSIAIMMSGGIALASILFTLGKGFNMNIDSYLFGNIYFLSREDIWSILGVTVFVLVTIVIYRKEFFLVSFDEDAAHVTGLKISFFNILLTVMTAMVITVAIKIVGALLVSALLTIPVACSLAIGRGFSSTLWTAALYSEIAVICGLIMAGLLNLAPGGTVVLLLIGLLVCTILVKRNWKH